MLDESLRVQSASRSFIETFKVDRYETVGQHLFDLGNGQWDIPELRTLLTAVIPKSTAVINYEVTHDFPDLGRRTMLLTARTLFHPDNASHSMLLAIVDATDSREREAAKDLLFGELRHRIKNLLAVAQSLACQTTTKNRTVDEYRDAFLGRFTALVEAQDLAFSEQDETGLGKLIERILAPYTADPAAVVIEAGAPIDLGPRIMMSISLVLHELATNAAKYGALSVSGGQVRVSWQVEDAGTQVRISWVESGGPPVSSPDSKSFGSHLIEHTTTFSLSGKVEQDYAPDGLRTEIVISLGRASLPG